MRKPVKIVVAGVGGQGVVYLTELLVETALLAGIPVATSEIHGLSQRGGSVSSSLTFGEGANGFVEKGGADFLLGLEAMEAMRCLSFLHTDSIAVIDNNRIPPYAVNAGKDGYPDLEKLLAYLQKNIRQLIFIPEMPQEVDPIMRNIYVLGCAARSAGFPLSFGQIRQTIKNTAKAGFAEKSLKALELGSNYFAESVSETKV
ncbi:MAG: 2-oxoacid:acceptor oxidoreductase family protein [Flavobacteriales bacterium]